MPTAPTHAFVAITIFASMRGRRWDWRLLLAGIACAMLPDIDVVGFAMGIRYGDVLGHRGLTHSPAFAAIVATLAVAKRTFFLAVAADSRLSDWIDAFLVAFSACCGGRAH